MVRLYPPSIPFMSYNFFEILDTWSLGDKAKFAKSSGMAGCCTWSLDQVSVTRLLLLFAHLLMLVLHQDDGFTLQDAIRAGLGLPK
jgi:chitinase